MQEQELLAEQQAALDAQSAEAVRLVEHVYAFANQRDAQAQARQTAEAQIQVCNAASPSYDLSVQLHKLSHPPEDESCHCSCLPCVGHQDEPHVSQDILCNTSTLAEIQPSITRHSFLQLPPVLSCVSNRKLHSYGKLL